MIPLFIIAAVLALTPPKTARLRWDYPPTSGVVFNVWETTDVVVPTKAVLGFSIENMARAKLNPAWRLSATLPGSARTHAINVDRPFCFYTVTASNTVTRLESPKP